ncbi:efflux RND transporter periplasmic adaptor subunit [Longimicrobium sp.]|uniref:efflux RND transporter periplasmic adaptor subunit n=1 Tax=Longimicrobium sp. TaxID=2029185 RepID=UPI002B71D3EF|nr:efflux RND transporter periplasmic adaptor subunit [Longimicrobium sp.]HSU16651.1 efflux RND transporter periplasmic adaptor subunit [Longimicrobium sp.]
MKKILIAVGVVVAVGGLGAVAVNGRGKSAGREVRSETVARRDLVATVTASGKIQPKRKVDISADVSGRVIQLPLEEGQWVNRGDLLLRIDPSQYEASVQQAQAGVSQNRAREAQARAQLLKAQSDARRAEQLAQGRDLVSAQEVDNARTQAQVAQAELQAARFAVNQAEALLAQARDNLRKTTIVAPMSGRVVRLNIHEGETAIIGTMNNPGSLLLTIADPSAMEAKVKVDETDVPGIQVGDSTTLRIDAFPDRSFTGRVTRIGNSAVQVAGAQAGGDQQAVDYEVVITLDHPPAELRPDLSATAEIVTDTRRQALSVPIIALTVRDHEGKKFKSGGEKGEEGGDAAPQQPKTDRPRVQDEVQGVFVIRGGKAVWTPVTVGITGGEYFEVTKGLRGGETIVAGTFQAVRDLEGGDAVRVPPAPAANRGQAKGGRR